MNPLMKLKAIQKELADKIRENHSEWDSITFRHQHIAYCELRGRKREEIECPNENNTPDENWIDRVKQEWEKAVHEWRLQHVQAK